MPAFLAASSLEAAWLIDAERYHVSAHGELSCQECHAEVAEQSLHPNPKNVNKSRWEFFDPDKCLFCHEYILEDLAQAVHGNRRVRDSERYKECLRCHDPHREPRSGPNRIGRFDPARPAREQCGACHEKRSVLPVSSAEDVECMTCHRRVDSTNPAGKEQLESLCLHCHGQSGNRAQQITGDLVPLLDGAAYRSTPHADLPCTACHPQSAAYKHGQQSSGSCEGCHFPHDEKVAHAAHAAVTCEACHLRGVRPVRSPEHKTVGWETIRDPDHRLEIHAMLTDSKTCRRCHRANNSVGAAAMVLPSKSIICMPCHAATFSIGDTTTILALIFFLLGIAGFFAYAATGTFPPARRKGVLPTPAKIISFLKTLLLDVLLQRRLYRKSRARWMLHSLIFLPFVFRFTWGLAALLTSLLKPQYSWVWSMLDKNDPLTAFLFDLSGLMILAGIGLALLRGQIRRRRQVAGLPPQDRAALGLLAAVVSAGFLLEGVRIAMTDWPPGSEFAFLGYPLSLLFGESEAWTGIYGYLWYMHAVLTGAFLVYLPFSRMLHIIVAPIVLASRAAATGRRDRG